MALQMTKHPMPEQDPEIRIHNFSEVALGYDEKTAIAEACRCLNCPNPRCIQGCPVQVNIPGFIAKIKTGDFASSIKIIKQTNSLPAICGRVCPQESQCEKYCVMGIKGEPVGIGRLERFVADRALAADTETKPSICNEHAEKVAVIGSGPAGLSAASELAKFGYRVTIFEALHKAGGVLSYGIPEFRLPKEKVVKVEIENLKKLGVKIELNSVVGKLYTVDELMNEEGFAAVFISTGAGLPRFMHIPGENLNGVYSANEFLTRCNLMKAYKFPEYKTPLKVGKTVAVIGGGNVAMDAARTSLRLGAEHVYIVYRRSEKELPARLEEVHHAKAEGIDFKLLSNPCEIIGNEDNSVSQLRCIKMALGEPDASGRCRPVPIEGSEFTLPVDTVIMSIGQGPNPLIQSTTPDMQTNKRGNIIADEKTGSTTKDGVFAGGDIVTGAATVILAMGAGKKAAKAIDEYLQNK
ncbi:NADPH-dependent glutamate synthase [Pectinatus sottacetonis]|uniref:NADPH-dependent glutamate synthase n=1 Tax=Pectinatus sottacetonis TaxID=1002795 RepID=UPI0018C60C28|nr:NADPH-dependent glutamate synthase [Pectinatus sottacetonis]